MTGRRAVVTGAGGGMGAAIVHELLDRGDEVLAVDCERETLDALGASGALTLAADVSSPAERERIAAAAGSVDYLVNAAGVIRVERLEEASREAWQATFGVNAEATFFLSQRLAEALRPGGAIVNVASAVARTPAPPEVAIYAASKAAVLSLTRSFALALAPRGIRVNALCPGMVRTAMQDTVLAGRARVAGTDVSQLRDDRVGMVPLGRAGEPADCALAVAFLLSDAAAYMTGQAVDLSGGLAMCP